jgi:hypothetical protein
MRSWLGDTITVNCEQCGQKFSFEVWSIVDMEERPDLAAKVMDASIRIFACPACGKTVSSVDPLLIYRPSQGGVGAMVFACSDADNLAALQEEAGPLASWVAHEVGASNDEIGIIPTPWRLLTVILERNIQADLETPDAYLDLPPELGASYREILGKIRKDRGIEWVTDLGDSKLPPVDYFENADVPGCSQCGKPFQATVCMIATERPGLAAKVRSGEIQSHVCPHCGKRVLLGAMLLVWRTRRSPRILVSPPSGMPTEMAVQAWKVLIEVLQRYVGAQFREEWISQARFLSRKDLAEMLSAGPA